MHRLRDSWHLALAIVICPVALLASAFLIGSTPDEEEFRFAVLSTWLWINSVGNGSLGFWTSTLGLGIPQPFIPNFILHPLAPLLGISSPVGWARTLLLAHTLVGAAGMWRLTRHGGTSYFSTSICVVTFLLATPTQNYILTDFWPSHYIVWTTAPWLLLLARRLLESSGSATPFFSVALGLAGGLVLASTNPGHAAVYGGLIAAVGLSRGRDVVNRAGWILLAAAIALAIGSPVMAQLAHERPMFGPVLRLENLPAPLPLESLWPSLLAPLAPGDPRTQFARTLFFGGPFVLLCVAGCLRLWKREPGLVLAIIVSALLLYSDAVPLPFLSARYQLRDPLILAGIPVAGLMLDRLLMSRHNRVGWVLAASQIVVLAASAWPALGGTWISDARRAQWFQGATGSGEAADALVALIGPGARLIFSPAADDDINEGLLVRDGIGVNALAYRGLTVVNGWFKGVSAGSVSPNERLFYGRVQISAHVLQSPAALDVLGIRYVVAEPHEAVAADLLRVGTVPRFRGELVVYENPDSWPMAFLLDPAAERMSPISVPGCPDPGMLCADFEALASTRTGDGAHPRMEDGRIEVRLPAADAPRLLVVSQMFRPDWVAHSAAQRLPVVPVAGGMLGVRVPGDVTLLELRYRPTVLLAAAVLALATIAGSGLALIVLGRGATLSVPLPSDSHRARRRRG